MICRSCGAEIADKAIVCYKCGEPTALPPSPPPRAGAPRVGARPWTWIVAMIAIVALIGWIVASTTTPGTPARVLALAAAVIVVIVAMAWLRPRRSGR